MKAFVLLALSLMMMGANCNKDKIKNYEEIVFTFDMPFTVKPGTESIRVGDTLTVFAEISDSMLDLRS
ncbi:MAG TPA: hypothetical protein VLL95_10970, partial [Phnomibacter sp.]|nr:hypothetical protein [Phnomibacter sp.]